MASRDDFLNAVKRITATNMMISEVIDLAGTLTLTGERDLAVQLYRIWIAFNQESPVICAANFNLAALLSDQGELIAAKEALEQAIAVNADFFPAYINLGIIYEKMGNVEQAVLRWQDLDIKLAAVTGATVGYKLTVLKQMGRVFEAHLRLETAESILRQSLWLNPHQIDVVEHYLSLRMQQCKWPIVEPWEGVSRKDLMAGMTPLVAATYTDDPILHLASAYRYNKNLDPAADDIVPKFNPTLLSSGRRRIGYLSSDLRGHAVGFLVSEVFEIHDRNRYEIFAYYCGPEGEDTQQARIKASVEHWVDVSQMNHAAVAQRIAADSIDILVDLNGYTRFARTEVMALRPAPIQVNWLGFPGTMGSPYYHYILADDWIIPENQEVFFSEKVLRLPCYQPNDRKRLVAPIPSRAEIGLPEAAMVYCCFNGWQKIGRFTFERWMEILRQVPDSILWLMEGGDSSGEPLKSLAESHGISASRLVFSPKLANPLHLARYPLADLFLDTSPYGAHTTASDALWMGVPILTLSGRGFASRVCGSLARAAGLGDLVCRTSEEYINLAVQLGQNRHELAELKKRLADGRSSCTLFDMERHVARLEALYDQMWEEYQTGALPVPDLANLDTYFEISTEVDHDQIEVQGIEDYAEWYRAKLARRHRYRPIPADARLWSPRP